MAQAALFGGLPLPGATAFTFSGWDLDDRPVVLWMGFHSDDPTGFMVCQGLIADGASAGDCAAFSILGATALEDTLLLGHSNDLHDPGLAVASVACHCLLSSFQPFGPSRAVFGGAGHVFLGLFWNMHQLGGPRAGLNGDSGTPRHAIVTHWDSARLDLEVLIARTMVFSIHPHSGWL